MKRENLAFFVGGLLFGILIGYALFDSLSVPRRAGSGAPAPPAASQAAPAPASQPRDTAPMLEEMGKLRTILDHDPKNVAALTRMANLYHDAGMWQSAVDWYGKALAVRPDDASNLTDMGICLRRLGRFDDALEAFRKALAIQPNQWQALYNQVVVLAFDRKEFDRAREVLDHLAKVRPDAPDLDGLRSRVEQARAQAAGD